MSKTGKTCATWVISVAIAGALALGAELAIAVDKSRADDGITQAQGQAAPNPCRD
jgi:hypothetical protein